MTLAQELVNDLSLKEIVLVRRMQKENDKKQNMIAMLFALGFILNFLIIGLSGRFHWQQNSLNIEALGYVMICLGYFLMFVSLKQNEYAAVNIDVIGEQKVFSNGLYSVVRHPMYLGNVIVLLFIPLAFGFYWDFLISFLLIIPLVMRTINEEKVLTAQLNGYSEYCKKVKWRLFPYMW